MPKTIPLSTPLQTHTGEVKELTLRDPIGADFIAINKLPFVMASDGTMSSTTPDFAVAAQWMARLSGVDAILIGTLGARDFSAVMRGLGDHLMAEADAPGN